MLKNFFTTAGRNIVKHKAYSSINFIGLTCGMALALLIITYVRSEMSYDQFHEKKDRLYRLSYLVPNGLKLATTPPPIAPVMADYFPEVEQTTRVYGRNVSIKRPDQELAFEESGIFFVDSTFMDLFTVDFVKGNPRKALHEKFTVVINEEMAKKYFGDDNPIGQPLLFGGKHSFKVIGVVKNFPENSHIRFDMLVPYENMFDMESDESAQLLRNNLASNFVISHSYTYVLLKPGADPANVNKNMGDFLKKHARPDRLIGQVFTLIPVRDIHLHSDLLGEPSTTNSMTNIYIFLGVGILTLLIACINYVNLSTAQSFTRIKEIGIRKILGSMKYQLIVQFLAESFLFSLVAMILSFGAFYFLLPLFNTLLDKHLLFSDIVDTPLLIISGLLILVITLLAGGYPAWFVTQFESVSSLKGSSAKSGSQFMRKALVVFQLAIACALLSGSLLIVKQLNFLTDRPLGFQRDHIINVPLYSQNLNGIFRREDSTFRMRLQSYRDAIESESGVTTTTLSSATPGLGAVYRGAIPEGFTREDNLFIANMSVDYDFLDTYGMQLIAGRSFSRDYPSDVREGYIINETAVREFKWETPEKALGKTMNREGKIGKIVGVVKDFNMTALTTPIAALLLEVDPVQFSLLSIKFENTNVQETIKKLEGKWNELFPEKAFEFTFLDEQLNQQYATYRNFGNIIKVFTFIAILISCLGVYGLVLFAVQRKVKEIGVRKVLGATIISILKLIYKDFAWLLAIGFLVAVPVSYYFLDKWLENFTYRTSLDVLTYLLSFAMVAVVVSLTIGYQALKASLANPVKSLRSE